MIRCTKCQLHKTRTQIVADRGPSPADVLFIMQSPDEGGDKIGKICTGKINGFITQMILSAEQTAGVKINSYHITGIVLCYSHANREPFGPQQDEIVSCSSNLLHTVAEVSPRLIVFVGKIVERYYKKEFPGSITIQPFETLLRQGGTSSPWYLTNTRILSEAFRVFEKG